MKRPVNEGVVVHVRERVVFVEEVGAPKKTTKISYNPSAQRFSCGPSGWGF